MMLSQCKRTFLVCSQCQYAVTFFLDRQWSRHIASAPAYKIRLSAEGIQQGVITAIGNGTIMQQKHIRDPAQILQGRLIINVHRLIVSIRTRQYNSRQLLHQ